MKQILKRIRSCSEADLNKIMRTIEQRFASAYPQWDVYYIALHKDPAVRAQQIEAIRSLASREPESQSQHILYFPTEE